MGKKIFVTYKYGDTKVLKLETAGEEVTKVRHYVTELQGLLKEVDHINKGEDDGQSLKDFKDETIESKLRQKIFDSTVTIAVVSKGMKDSIVAEDDQWMPWEISYSLKEHTRGEKTSATNAVLALVLPDENGSYEYYVKEDTCPKCKCRTLLTEFLFRIMRDNMFNIKNPKYNSCDNHFSGSKVYLGDSSYIPTYKWTNFIADIDGPIDKALDINSRIDDYNIVKTVK